MIVKIYFDSEIIFSEDVEKFHDFECSRTIKNGKTEKKQRKEDNMLNKMWKKEVSVQMKDIESEKHAELKKGKKKKETET